MIKLIFLVLVGCASLKTEIQQLPVGKTYSIIPLAHQSLAESRKMMNNKRNFLLAIFEQYHDPYYNISRWTKECIDENQIGVVQESSDGIFFVSQLYLNHASEPGFCSSLYYAVKSYVVYYQCKGSQTYTQIRIPSDDFFSTFNWSKLCI